MAETDEELQVQKKNLCLIVRRLLASKHLKKDPDVVQMAKDYLTRINGWGSPLRDTAPETTTERVVRVAYELVEKGPDHPDCPLIDLGEALDAHTKARDAGCL